MNGRLMMRFGNRIIAYFGLLHAFLFPKRCLGCNKLDLFVCDSCLDLINIKNNFCCPVCNREMPYPKACDKCVEESLIDGLWVVSNYKDELVKKSIHLIKYNYCDEIGEVWEKMISRYFLQERFWLDDALLIPVPLHGRRYLERGFNQSMIVCNILNNLKRNDIGDNILVRKNYGKHQATLDFNKRKENVINCFRLTSNVDCRDYWQKEVILIDDVYTTGATMEECAKILKKAGFKRVYGFAMARG